MLSFLAKMVNFCHFQPILGPFWPKPGNFPGKSPFPAGKFPGYHFPFPVFPPGNVQLYSQVKHSNQRSQRESCDFKMELPDKVLLKIFGYLSTKDILCKIAFVSKHCNLLTKHPDLIKTLDYTFNNKYDLDYIANVLLRIS